MASSSTPNLLLQLFFLGALLLCSFHLCCASRLLSDTKESLATEIGSRSSTLLGASSLENMPITTSSPMLPTDQHDLPMASLKRPMFFPDPFGIGYAGHPITFPFPSLPTLPKLPPLPTFPFIPTMPSIPSIPSLVANSPPPPPGFENSGSFQRADRGEGTPWNHFIDLDVGGIVCRII